jgi:hypothetical protein
MKDNAPIGVVKENTATEVMKAIVDNNGPVRAYVAEDREGWEDQDNWRGREISGVDLHSKYPFNVFGTYYKRCSLIGPTIKKTRPMTARELALWMIKHPTYAVTCKDWGDESWTHDITWVTAMAKNPSNWNYADFEDLEFPRWEPIPEVEAD